MKSKSSKHTTKQQPHKNPGQKKKENKTKTKKTKKRSNVSYSVETRDSTVTRSTGIEADTATRPGVDRAPRMASTEAQRTDGNGAIPLWRSKTGSI